MLVPTQQEITIKMPVTLSINQQGERYQFLLNDQTFNFYKNETLDLRVSGKYLTVGVN